MSLPTNIKNILNDKVVESVRLELKEGWNPEKIMHTICAFANDINNFSGGYIVIGIQEKDGRPIFPLKGLSINEIDKIQKEIIDYCKKSIEPKYIPEIEVVEYQGVNLIVIWAYAGSDRPYKCLEKIYVKADKTNSNKSYYIRKGSATIKATSSDEKELFNLSGLNPFDDRINYKAEISDLNINLIRNYLRDIGSNLFEVSEKMDIYQLCESLRICDGPIESIHPKNVGLLFFSYTPEKFLPYSYIDLTIIYDPTGEGMIEKTFKGPLHTQYNAAMFFIKNNVIQEKVFKVPGQMEAKRYFNYPYEAIEEILGNAILHKNYQIQEPISIRITRTEIEITSLPGIDSSISNTDIKSFRWRTRRYRNRRISEFLKELNIVEAKNTGIPTILKYLKLNESTLPNIEMDAERSFLTITLPIHKVFLESNDSNLILEDKANVTIKSIIEKKGVKNAILVLLSQEPSNLTTLSKKLGYTSIPGGVKKALEALVNESLIDYNKRLYSITKKGTNNLIHNL